MRNIPSSLREQLVARCSITPLSTIESEGRAGATRKLVVALADGEQLEEVLIPAPGRNTVCVSSQAGCRYRCAFCASGQAGLSRNLTAAEMVGQVLLAVELLGERPSHVVFMGIGEPLDNYTEVLKAVRIINDGEGLAIGARRITISTCGLIPGIKRLADEGLQVELSVSLHAPDDELRSELMPVNDKYPMSDLLAACERYTDKTGRIVTFEYTLVRDLNDSIEQAHALADLLAPLHCRANLIPLSAVSGFDGEASTTDRAEAFIEILADSGINATLRVSKGSGLKAACGQLRYRKAPPSDTDS